MEAPATVRIESNISHAMDIPIPGPGNSIRGYVRIPGMKGKDPGVLETTELDVKTLQRLRYNYEWRPTDRSLYGKPKSEIPPDQILNINMLKITVLPPAKPSGKSSQS